MRLIDADAIEMELGVEDRDLYVQHILDSTPTVEAEPIKHGEWIPITACQAYKCSACGFGVMTGHIEMYKRCHNCGAVMHGVKNEKKDCKGAPC